MAYFFGLLLLATQVYLFIHAYRSGKTNWLYFIAFLPLIGGLAYFVTEWVPDFERRMNRTGSGQHLDEIATDVVRLANPTRHLAKLKEQLEFSDTFENRIALARECVHSRLYDEAIEMYTSALTGIFADNPSARKELAQTYFLNEEYEQAKQEIDELRLTQPEFKQTEVSIFYARTLEKLGRDDDALAEYDELVSGSAGYEARVRYALLLKKNGHLAEATRHFTHVVSRAKQATRQYRRSHRQWIDIARQNLE